MAVDQFMRQDPSRGLHGGMGARAKTVLCSGRGTHKLRQYLLVLLGRNPLSVLLPEHKHIYYFKVLTLEYSPSAPLTPTLTLSPPPSPSRHHPHPLTLSPPPSPSHHRPTLTLSPPSSPSHHHPHPPSRHHPHPLTTTLTSRHHPHPRTLTLSPSPSHPLTLTLSPPPSPSHHHPQSP